MNKTCGYTATQLLTIVHAAKSAVSSMDKLTAGMYSTKRCQ